VGVGDSAGATFEDQVAVKVEPSLAVDRDIASHQLRPLRRLEADAASLTADVIRGAPRLCSGEVQREDPDAVLDTMPFTAATNCSAFATSDATSVASGVPAP